MSVHPVLVRLADLVRTEPSLTVAQLAQRLGYAEQKSIYYWLEKVGFRSIRVFRDAVLTGRFPPDRLPAWPARLGEAGPTLDMDAVAIMEVRTPGTIHATGSSLGQALRHRMSSRGFAFLLQHDDYVPLLLKGDLLLVEPAAFTPNGSLVLAWSTLADRVEVYRHHQSDPPGTCLLYHPVRGHQQRQAITVLGLIVGTLRLFR